MIHIGFQHYLAKSKIVAILPFGSRQSVAYCKVAESDGKLFDATAGRKAISYIVTDTGHIFKSSREANTLRTRFNGGLDDDEETVVE